MIRRPLKPDRAVLNGDHNFNAFNLIDAAAISTN